MLKHDVKNEGIERTTPGGEVVFEGEGGKVYVGTVEFMIGEANPDYVAAVLNEEK